MLDLACCSSVQRSLMAWTDPRRATEGLIQSFWRDDSGSSFTGSVEGTSDPLATEVGKEDGNTGRRSSVINCDNWEWVLDV